MCSSFRYFVTVRRAGTLDSGLAEGAGLVVDGQRIAGTLLPLAPAGKTVQVEVILPG